LIDVKAREWKSHATVPLRDHITKIRYTKKCHDWIGLDWACDDGKK
jgi:hypothetical protein